MLFIYIVYGVVCSMSSFTSLSTMRHAKFREMAVMFLHRMGVAIDTRSILAGCSHTSKMEARCQCACEMDCCRTMATLFGGHFGGGGSGEIGK